MAMTLEEKKEVLAFIPTLSRVVRDRNWISHYDTDSDSFIMRTPQLSSDARKKYLNNEFAFYLAPSGKVEGLFIEYFRSNFISHHKKDFTSLNKELGKKHNEIVSLNEEEISELTPKLEAFIIDSIAPSPESTSVNA